MDHSASAFFEAAADCADEQLRLTVLKVGQAVRSDVNIEEGLKFDTSFRCLRSSFARVTTNTDIRYRRKRSRLSAHVSFDYISQMRYILSCTSSDSGQDGSYVHASLSPRFTPLNHPFSRESRSRISDAGRRFDATRAQPTSPLISFVSLAILQKHVVSSNAVDRRRRPRFEQHQLRLHGRRLDRRRFPLAFPLAQEASSPSQEQKRTPGTGETAQEASPESRTESRLHSQPDQAVDAEQRANLLR